MTMKWLDDLWNSIPADTRATITGAVCGTIVTVVEVVNNGGVVTLRSVLSGFVLLMLGKAAGGNTNGKQTKQ